MVVRSSVSGDTSAANEFGVTSRAVKQTPLTAIESPFAISDVTIDAETTILALVAMLSKHRLCPTLAVVKRMAADPGAESLAFADAGVALAVDLPRGPRLAPAARDISALVAAAGGRFYLAKDALLDGAELRLTDPRAADFAAWRRDCGLNVRFVSGQSERLGL